MRSRIIIKEKISKTEGPGYNMQGRIQKAS
jgi:hypothetical protein